MTYYVYIVITVWSRLYTGVTTDIKRRVYEHNNTNKGAKSLRGQRPVKLVWYSELMTKSDALKLEYKIKHLSPRKKRELIVGDNSVLD